MTPISVNDAPRRVLINPISPTQIYLTTSPESTIMVIENGEQISAPGFDSLSSAGYMEYILKVYPPSNVSGQVIYNKFALLTDIVNRLQWTASLSSNIAGYTITRNGTYLTTVNGTAYNDYNRPVGATDTYVIRAKHVDSAVSAPVTITLSQ